MATKQEIIDRLSQCGGLSYQDWIVLFDSIYFDGDIGDIFIPITSNILPENENSYTIFSIITEGTYTQGVGAPIVVPEGHISIISNSGETWISGISVNVQGNSGINGKTAEVFNPSKIGGYAVGDSVYYPPTGRKKTYLVVTATAMGESPDSHPAKFEIVGGGEIISTIDLNSEEAVNSEAVNSYITGHFVEDEDGEEISIRSFPSATAYTAYPQGVISGANGTIVNTSNTARRWSGNIDVSQFKKVRFENLINRNPTTLAVIPTTAISVLNADNEVIYFTETFDYSQEYTLPKGAKWFRHNVYAGGVFEINYSDYDLIGIKPLVAYTRNELLQDFIENTNEAIEKIDELESEVHNKIDLSWIEKFSDDRIIDINSSFKTGTQEERIQQALDFAEGQYYTLILGEDTINSTTTWNITKSLEIGSATRLKIGSGIKIKFSQNGVVDNIIRNKGIGIDKALTLHSTAYMNPPAVGRIKQDYHIVIEGAGNELTFIEGSDVPYNAPRPNGAGGGANEDWVGDNYGYRTISVLMANVNGVKVGGYRLTNPKSWGTVFEYCRNFLMEDIYTNSTNIKNGDGCDIIMCKYGKVNGVYGKTFDDLLFVGGIPRTKNITYPDYSRYIYPTHVTLELLKTLPLSEQDTHDVYVDNLNGGSKTITLRVLATMGVKTYNIYINNVQSQTIETYRPYSILSIETGYNINGGSVAQVGDMHNINANNVGGTFSTDRTIIKTPLRNSWLNNIQKRNSTTGVVFNGYPQDASVKVTNLFD